MIFDTEEQKQRVINMIGEVPIHTTVAGLMSGPSPDLMSLVSAMHRAEVLSPDEQTVLMLRKSLMEVVGDEFDPGKNPEVSTED